MTWKRGLFGAAVIALLLLGGFFAYRQFFAARPAETPPAVTDAAPTADTIAVRTAAGSVSAEGQIVPLRHAALAFAAPGTVSEVLAGKGERVEVGQPIVRLDTGDQELALQQARAALAQAEANLTAAQAGLHAAETGIKAADLGVQAAEVERTLAAAEPRPEEIAIQESNVALARARIGQAAAAQALVLEGAGESAVRAAEAEVSAAEARAVAPRLRLEELRAQSDPDPEDLAQAEQDYNAALAAIEAARGVLTELQAGATAAQRQAASSGLAAAGAQRDAAQAELDLLLAGSQTEQIAIAEARVRQAEAARAEARAAQASAEAAVRQAEAQVSGAQAAVMAAQTALDNRTLTAPFSGTVADVLVSRGEVVNAGAPVAVVADFSAWLVETTDLTELDVVGVAAGFPAEVRADALLDETLTGTVTDIATVSQELRGDVTYTVTIRLDEAPGVPLRWGMTVFATIGTGN